VNATATAAMKEDGRLRALFHSVPDALLIAGNDRCFRDLNPAACKLFGMSHDDLVGRSVDQFSAGDAEATWSAFLRDGYQQGELALHRPNGEVRTVELRALAHFYDGEHLFVLQDVTEARLKAASAMDAKDALLTACSNSLDQAPLAYVHTDGGGTIRYANWASCRLLNMPSSFVHGNELVNFVVRRDVREFRALVKRCCKVENAGVFRCGVRPRHLKVILADLSVAALRAGGIGWIIRDSSVLATRMDGSAMSAD
jgi:PAS domain S-box-containing protein